MRNKSTLVFNLILLSTDFISLVAAFVLAYVLRVKIDTRPLIQPLAAITFLKIHLLILPFWLVIFGKLGLYNSEKLGGRLSELTKILIGCAGGTVLIIVIDFLSRQPVFPARLVPLYGFSLAFLLVGLNRQIIYKTRHWLYRLGIGIKKVALVGQGPVSRQLLSSLSDSAGSGYQLVALINGPRTKTTGIARYRNFRSSTRRLLKAGVDEIIQTELFNRADRNAEVLKFARTHHIKYRFYPTPSEL